MRLPNGYGSITKLSGKRRKPWIVRITDHYTDEGKEVRKILGYFPSRAEALKALSCYNDNPYDIDASKITLAELYEKWYPTHITDDTNISTIKQTRSSFNHLKPLHNTQFKDIKVPMMQNIIDKCQRGYQCQRKIKQLLGRLYEFAIDNEVVRSNPTGRLKIAAKIDETARKRVRISDDTINRLWAISGTAEAQIALMLIYSGVRVSELLDLKKENVHLEERYFEVKESKTSSGIRIVPIAEKVYPFWKHFMETSPCSYVLYSMQGRHIVYDNFAKHYWKPLMQQLGTDHVIHETRHTCISLLTLADVNPTIIKNIVGHKSAMSLTERVYTHFDIKPLIDAINKI